MKAIQGSIIGSRALERHLREIEKRLGHGAHVRVGFLESASYPSTGKGSKPLHVAQVAFWNQYGTSRAPARPFFTDMIERKSPRWGVSLGNILRKNGYDAERSLALMGEGIKGQLQKSINDWSEPPNAQITADRKGFNKPLIHHGIMLRSVDYQVMNGDGGDDDHAGS